MGTHGRIYKKEGLFDVSQQQVPGTRTVPYAVARHREPPFFPGSHGSISSVSSLWQKAGSAKGAFQCRRAEPAAPPWTSLRRDEHSRIFGDSQGSVVRHMPVHPLSQRRETGL